MYGSQTLSRSLRSIDDVISVICERTHVTHVGCVRGAPEYATAAQMELCWAYSPRTHEGQRRRSKTEAAGAWLLRHQASLAPEPQFRLLGSPDSLVWPSIVR
jgi:hypothetical protein